MAGTAGRARRRRGQPRRVAVAVLQPLERAEAGRVEQRRHPVELVAPRPRASSQPPGPDHRGLRPPARADQLEPVGPAVERRRGLVGQDVAGKQVEGLRSGRRGGRRTARPPRRPARRAAARRGRPGARPRRWPGHRPAATGSALGGHHPGRGRAARRTIGDRARPVPRSTAVPRVGEQAAAVRARARTANGARRRRGRPDLEPQNGRVPGDPGQGLAGDPAGHHGLRGRRAGGGADEFGRLLVGGHAPGRGQRPGHGRRGRPGAVGGTAVRSAGERCCGR